MPSVPRLPRRSLPAASSRFCHRASAPSSWLARSDREQGHPRSRLRSMPRAKTNWKERPDDHDYPAAENYLSLLMPPSAAKRVAARLRKAPIVHWMAKDLLRPSRLPILEADSYHVAKDLRKVKAGKKLSPVLLVRGRLEVEIPLTIADGYHRGCASYHLAEDSAMPCRMV